MRISSSGVEIRKDVKLRYGLKLADEVPSKVN